MTDLTGARITSLRTEGSRLVAEDEVRCEVCDARDTDECGRSCLRFGECSAVCYCSAAELAEAWANRDKVR